MAPDPDGDDDSAQEDVDAEWGRKHKTPPLLFHVRQIALQASGCGCDEEQTRLIEFDGLFLL